jgi:hypothetical protein
MRELTREEKRLELAKCKACDLEEYLNSPSTDLEACCPPALNHTCALKGPRTKKAILKAIEEAAWELHNSFSSLMPGGDYHSEQELERLIFRLANLRRKKVAEIRLSSVE